MKKLIPLILLGFLSFLIGCDWFQPVTTQSQVTTTSSSTNSTTLSSVTQTTREVTITYDNNITVKLKAGNDTVEINTSWIDAGAVIVIDDEERAMSTTDTVDESTIDLYSITYQYLYLGETYSITRFVVVVDQIAPVLTLNLGIDTVILGNSWVDAGVNASDNSLSTPTIVVTGTVNTSVVGTYPVTYTATDSVGNSFSIVRYVTVVSPR